MKIFERLLFRKNNRLDLLEYSKIRSVAKKIEDEFEKIDGALFFNKYGGYCISNRLHHRPAVKKIKKGKIYEPKTIVYIRENCAQGDIIHAGTFFGDFLPGISKKLGPNNKIWAFEPNSHSFQCAKLTIAVNQLKNVTITNAGLGISTGEGQLLIKDVSGRHLGGASKIIDKKEQGITEEIRVVSIDEMIPANRTISIIQLDVEGYEKQALLGALTTIERCKPILILEDNNNIIGSPWFDETLGAMGYQIFGMVHHNTILKYVKDT